MGGLILLHKRMFGHLMQKCPKMYVFGDSLLEITFFMAETGLNWLNWLKCVVQDAYGIRTCCVTATLTDRLG